MDNTTVFQFRETVLEKYLGPGGDVVIPEGVTAIGSNAFSKCEPLTSVTIPGSVTSIGECAFYGCANLVRLALPEGLASIGRHAFHWCKSLTAVTIPHSVTDLAMDAFTGCVNLNAICMSQRVFDLWNWTKAFGLSFGIVVCEDSRWQFYGFATSSLLSGKYCDNLKDFVRTSMWSDYDRELVNNGPGYKYKIPAKLLGCLGRLVDPVELSDENRSAHLEYLIKNAKKLIPIAEELRCPAIVEAMLRQGIINDKNRKSLMKLIAASACPEIAALADGVSIPAARKTPAVVKSAVQPSGAEPDLAQIYAQKWTAIKGSAILKKMKLLGVSIPEATLKDGSPAPKDLFRFILVSYGKQLGMEPVIDPDADEAASLLAYDSLCSAMDAVSGNLNGPAYPSVLPMLCRYGSPSQIKQLVCAWKDWGNWNVYGSRGRTAQSALEQAMVLSDTRAAAIFLEQRGQLSAYARFRGLSEDEVYENYLFNFGFDENGRRVLDLGITTVEVTLTPEITLAMVNTATGKPVKSIPKAKVDPAVYKKAVNDLDDMSQNLKKAISIKQKQLWHEYLEAVEVSPELWKKRYLSNPFLNRVARILVWEQEKKTFLLTPEGTVDSAGSPYELSDAPIRLAHPMEMDAQDVSAWQKYFIAHGLKQPFQQIWEPVYQQTDIREDRYRDCLIKAVYMKKQEHRGIHLEWYATDYHQERSLQIQGFDLTVDVPCCDSSYLVITSICPQQWTRRANMIISCLDRMTISDRIKKDDPSVMQQMAQVTQAQIVDYIDLAQSSGAVNVLALLLELKNARFGDFDALDAFTLDW